MEDLMDYLYSLIWKYKLGIVADRTLPSHFPSRYIPSTKTIIVNLNWYKKEEIPFMVAHEIGHYINGDSGVSYYEDPIAPIKDIGQEHQANLYSLNLLYNYALDHGNTFDEPIEFMHQYGIPMEMLDDTKQLFNRNNDLFT